MKRTIVVFGSAACLLLAFTQDVVSQGTGTVMNILYLDGNSGYVELPSGITYGLSEATVEVWVRWESFNKWSRVFDFGKKGNAAVLQNEKKSSKVHFSIWNRGGKRHRVTARNRIEKGTWHHVAAVASISTGMRLYIDGSAVAGEPFLIKAVPKAYQDAKGQMKFDVTFDTLRTAFSEVSVGSNYIGKSNWYKDELFHGYISELRVWNIVRTKEQIESSMYAPLYGNEDGLLCYCRFDTERDGVVKDLTKRGNDATLVDGASIFSALGPPVVSVAERDRRAWEKYYKESHEYGKHALQQGDYDSAIKSLSQVGSGYEEYQDVQALLRKVQKIRERQDSLYQERTNALREEDRSETIEILTAADTRRATADMDGGVATRKEGSELQQQRVSQDRDRSGAKRQRKVSARENRRAKIYTLTFVKQNNVSIRAMKENSRSPGTFSYEWRHVCGICRWKDSRWNSGKATGSNGGFTKAFSCFACFKAKRRGHNSGRAHMTEVRWTIGARDSR